MKVWGIILTILGVLLVIIGAVANQRVWTSARLFMKYGSDPGSGFIIFGIMAFAVGIVLLVLRHTKKKSPPQ